MHIRPICLIQVERTGRDQRLPGVVHAEDAREYLMEHPDIGAEQIAVKTSTRVGWTRATCSAFSAKASNSCAKCVADSIAKGSATCSPSWPMTATAPWSRRSPWYEGNAHVSGGRHAIWCCPRS